jgi:hypothetical protein
MQYGEALPFSVVEASKRLCAKGQWQWSADVSSLVWASAVHGSGFRPGVEKE